MKLLEEVSINNTDGEFLYISKLDDLERKNFKANFVVSRTKPTQELLLREDTTKFLQDLKSERYEGLFQTEIECMYHVRLYEAMVCIKMYDNLLSKVMEVKPFDPFSEKFNKKQ